MAFHLISTAIATQALGHNDSLLLTETGSVTNGGSGAGITTTGLDHDVELVIDGNIYMRDNAIQLHGTDAGTAVASGLSGADILIGSGATVASGEMSGIHTYGAYVTLTNHGTVLSRGDTAAFNGDISTVHNTGIINSMSGFALAFVPDVSVGSRTIDVFNSGTITGSNAVDNTGDGALMHVDNTGALVATGFYGIYHDPGVAGYSLIVSNSGSISSPRSAIWAARTSNDNINNSGTITGDLGLGGGDDVLRNSGDITGLINLGVGNDSYLGFGGVATDLLYGDDGDDVFHIDDPTAQIDGGADTDTVNLLSDLRGALNIEIVNMWGDGGFTYAGDATATQVNGNAGDNMILGDAGNDTLRGRQGDDALFGGDDDDVIIGNSGEDEIDGGAGHDHIFGGRGADELLGGFGNDTIAGGAGDDTISGGGAKDILSGGYGNDVFFFESAADAGSGAQADRIDNFARGEDVIDLVALGTTPASFIGTAGFSGGGNMEVRYTVNPFGNALVRIDEDGNGTEDARVVVAQTSTLDAGDFLL